MRHPIKALSQRTGFLLLILALSSNFLAAREGMWLPHLIEQLNADEMTRMGMQISAEDIYSVNKSSIKDAIVHFGGGCTAELVSDQGLLLTNHHCGYRRIQSHSSLEDNYLRDGFWAMSKKEELTNPGLTASIVKYMKDVTGEVLDGVSEGMDQKEKELLMRQNVDSLLKSVGDEYELEVKPFFYGNQYILIAKETFEDVRLVGAPPSSIGKFGADTDNWVWPRHTGDFSLFRVYAGTDNRPAPVSEENVPYRPLYHLKVNIGGFQENDFTMIYGFPGTTAEYLPSNEIKNIVEVYDPARIAVRDELLAILDKKMRQNEETRIKYASKYAGISNSWKKWIGEVKGLTETNAVEKKELQEAQFKEAISTNAVWQEKYHALIDDMKTLYDERKPLMLERYMYLETHYFGNELVKHLLGYRGMMELYELEDEVKLAAEASAKAEALEGFYKDFDAELGREAMKVLLPTYLEHIPENPSDDYLAELKSMDDEELEDYIDDMYKDLELLKDPEKWRRRLEEKPMKAMKKLKKSEAMKLTMAGWSRYLTSIRPGIMKIDSEIELLQAEYLQAITEIFPKKRIYPDANSTLRVAYGQIDGYVPRDAVKYETQTYLHGVMAKYVPGDYEFDLPEKLIRLYEQKDYGQYAEGDKMPVCFIASNHTTGGNSGSPALNGRGELIGLNFDRTWEGTMSDYHYDISRCRNIMVDARYILFIIDKFAGAGYLVDEMDIVTAELPVEEEEQTEEPVTEGI